MIDTKKHGKKGDFSRQEMCFNFGLKCIRAREHSAIDHLQTSGLGPDYNPNRVRYDEKYRHNLGGTLWTYYQRYRTLLGPT